MANAEKVIHRVGLQFLSVTSRYIALHVRLQNTRRKIQNGKR